MNIPDGSLCVSISLNSAMASNDPKAYFSAAVMDLLRSAALQPEPMADSHIVIALIRPTKEPNV